jgi:cytochrome c553
VLVREWKPIGQRIVEVPNDPILTTLRDWRIGFTTYVPPGSIKKGEALVTTGGNGKTVQCTICHGSDLRGIGPSLRLPAARGSTLPAAVRLQGWARHGAWSQMMKPVVQNLTLDDMIAIVAYTSSRMP